MPLPFIIATGAIGLLGIGGHLSAKETNEKAEMIVERAKNVYHDARLSLETAKYNAEESLTALGYAKKNVLEGSIKQFVQAFERIKDDVRLRDSTGMNEVSHFANVRYLFFNGVKWRCRNGNRCFDWPGSEWYAFFGRNRSVHCWQFSGRR